MSVRNLREWRTLGLLPAPEKRGRVGYYGPAVVERLERVKELHAEGFPLELIARMLDDGNADEIMRLAATLHAPVGAATPEQRLARVRAALEPLKLPEEQMAAALAGIQHHAEEIAVLFERLWLEHVWEPFVDAGRPTDELSRIQEIATQVKPLALETVGAVFAAAMDAQIERGIARELERAAER